MRHLNPLYILDKKICPELVLAARLLAVYLLITREGAFMGNQGGGRFLPLLDVLNDLGSDAAYNLGVRSLGWLGMLLVLFSSHLRTGAFLTGISIVIGNISCQTCTSVAHLFTSCVFLCTALSNRVTGSQLLRFQLIVLYTGANINKIVDQDWWNGAAIETLLVTKHQIPFYMQVSEWFPPMFLSTVTGISVMLLQLLIPFLLLGKNTFKYACLAAVLLHMPMVLMMQMTFGPFLFALTIAYGSLLTWPEKLRFDQHAHSPLIVSTLCRLDFNGQIIYTGGPAWASTPLKWIRTIIDLIPHPAVLFAFTILAAMLVRYGQLLPLCAVLLFVFFVKVLFRSAQKESVARAVSV